MKIKIAIMKIIIEWIIEVEVIEVEEGDMVGKEVNIEEEEEDIEEHIKEGRGRWIFSGYSVHNSINKYYENIK